jgi:hypothetical protein
MHVIEQAHERVSEEWSASPVVLIALDTFMMSDLCSRKWQSVSLHFQN